LRVAYFGSLSNVQWYGIIDRAPTFLFCPVIWTWQNQISRRSSLRALACGLVFLGMCVFAWGLRYKLSLYDPPHSITHRIPAAKLLTGKERVEVPVLDTQRAANPAGPAILLAFTLAFVFLGKVSLIPATSWQPAWLVPAPLKPSCLISVSCWSRPPPQSR
jgi:hypothetical protein